MAFEIGGTVWREAEGFGGEGGESLEQKAAGLAVEIGEAVWGPGLLIFLLAVGAVFTLGSGFFPIRCAGFIWRSTLGGLFSHKKSVAAGGVSPFQAMSTALGATVGTGNVVGVAAALVSGGPGAIFWMWAGAALGMMTKFAEATLAVIYRERGGDKIGRGGPMYYIEKGLKMRWLAGLFAGLCVLGSFGMGNMVQTNSAAAACEEAFGIPPIITGVTLAGLTALVLFAGVNSVTRVAGALVPAMALLYTAGALAFLLINSEAIPKAFGDIIEGAFSFKAAGGGLVGTAIRAGISRGVFSNEAGMGTAAIAHAASSEESPARQGCWGILEVFIDTIVICTLTALVLMTSGLPLGGELEGARLAAEAFGSQFGAAGEWLVAISLLLFAFATLLGWAYYGESALFYLTGGRFAALTAYKLLFVFLAAVGSFARMPLVWSISDIFNGLMAVPNLVALLFLSPAVFRAIKEAERCPEDIK